MRTRRSPRRFLQESWRINFESFPASASSQSRQENTAFQTRYFSRIKCSPGNADSTFGAITACPKREPSSHGAAGLSRATGKRRYALWNSGPRPERHRHKSLFARGVLHRCQCLSARVRCERPVHRKDFPRAVTSHELRVCPIRAGIDCAF